MVRDRTNIYLSKPQKAALEKIAKEKGISVAELVRRILDKELDREQKTKRASHEPRWSALVADEHNISVKERWCRATVTPVASAALVLRTHSFLFRRYRRVVCFTWLQTQRAHAADTTPVLQHPKNQHRLAEQGIFSKEEKLNFHANREGLHRQLVAANRRSRTLDAPVCWLQAVGLRIVLCLWSKPATAEARTNKSASRQ